LNAMISALLGAGEPQAAESIYDRMKKIHAERTDTRLPPWDFKKRRIINSRLLKWAKISRDHPERQEIFQNRTIIAPDIRTYRILIHHSAVRAGNLEKASRLLSEMSIFKIPLHGALFLTLFKGFAVHGGIRYTQWDSKRLESVWSAFNKALDSDVEGLYISKWMVNWVLAAFAKCSGKSRTIAVWEEIKEKWEPEEADLDFVMSGLRRILEDGEQYGVEKRRDWALGE
jgi:pentatricopeptide repeat protein